MTSSLEFSHVVDLAKKETDKFSLVIEANEAERIALARRFSVDAIDTFHIEAAISCQPGGRVIVSAAIRAEVRQTCVLSLVPVISNLAESFELELEAEVDLDDGEDSDQDDIIDVAERDQEFLIDGCFDLGELSAQYLGLALDPYPRADGVTIEDLAKAGYEIQSEEAAAAASHPFAGLKELQDKT